VSCAWTEWMQNDIHRSDYVRVYELTEQY
jgi:hypothetical protein